MHGMEASPVAWLRSHAIWGRYLPCLYLWAGARWFFYHWPLLTEEGIDRFFGGFEYLKGGDKTRFLFKWPHFLGTLGKTDALDMESAYRFSESDIMISPVCCSCSDHFPPKSEKLSYVFWEHWDVNLAIIKTVLEPSAMLLFAVYLFIYLTYKPHHLGQGPLCWFWREVGQILCALHDVLTNGTVVW